MRMHDFVIRNGLLLDGLGSPPVHGDLAVRDGRIAGVGRDLGDAQLTWDPAASPSPALGRLPGRMLREFSI
jgi:N-acyl-D-aspartate/D-glutamate deacylase